MTTTFPVIQAVATAVPPHRVEQEYAREFAAALFERRYRNIDRLLPIFRNTQIQTRYLARPAAWFEEEHTFPAANEVYQQVATAISVEAAEKAIGKAGVPRQEIGMVVFVSSTGIATPSLDAKLIQALGLGVGTGRLPIWGLGCAGGVAGLARAAEIARTMPGQSVLLVAVELCSITFQRGDLSKSNLVATALFGDGAAAVLLRVPEAGAEEESAAGPTLLGSHSHLFPDSEEVMGWEVVDRGLKVQFARSIPALVDRELSGVVAEACSHWQVDPAQVTTHFVAHPGGPRVLESYASSLGVGEARLASSYDVLRRYGNMSSPTVLFVLERFLETTPRQQALGLMLALGPGFSAEQILFRW